MDLTERGLVVLGECGDFFELVCFAPADAALAASQGLHVQAYRLQHRSLEAQGEQSLSRHFNFQPSRRSEIAPMKLLSVGVECERDA